MLYPFIFSRFYCVHTLETRTVLFLLSSLGPASPMLHDFNYRFLCEIDHKSIDVFNTRVLGNGNLMISDVKLQHAGVYVCRATTPGTRNFTVAMATLTVLGMFYFIFQSQFCILFYHWLFYPSHTLLYTFIKY